MSNINKDKNEVEDINVTCPFILFEHLLSRF